MGRRGQGKYCRAGMEGEGRKWNERGRMGRGLEEEGWEGDWKRKDLKGDGRGRMERGMEEVGWEGKGRGRIERQM
jgi:hypothetical protein